MANIEANLPSKRIDAFEFFFRSKIADESNFEILAVDVAIEIEKVNLKDAVGPAFTHCRSATKVYHAMMYDSFEFRFCEINPVWWELLIVRA